MNTLSVPVVLDATPRLPVQQLPRPESDAASTLALAVLAAKTSAPAPVERHQL